MAGAALVSTALMLAGTLFGVPGALLTLLVPVPAAWVQMRSGLVPGIGAVLLTAVAASWVGGAAGVVAYLMQFGLVALLLPWCLRRGWAWDRAVAVTVLAVVLTASLALVVVSIERGQSIPQLVDAYIATEIGQARSLLGDSNLTPVQQSELEVFFADFARFLGLVYPGLAIVASALMNLLTVWFLARFGIYLPGRRFADWRASELLVWPLIVAGFLHVLAEGVAGQIGSNLLVVLLLVYYLQGLAVVTYMFDKRQVHPFLRNLIYLLVLFANPLPLLVAGVGLFDLWINFRKDRKLKT